MATSETVQLRGRIAQQTDKAILYETDMKPAGVWLPKSQIQIEHPLQHVTLPEWLALEKGLI